MQADRYRRVGDFLYRGQGIQKEDGNGMANTQKSETRFTLKRFLLSLAVWFVVCLVIYGLIYIREHNQTQRLISTGVAISRDISSQSGCVLHQPPVDPTDLRQIAG